jgi:hypothetical protein
MNENLGLDQPTNLTRKQPERYMQMACNARPCPTFGQAGQIMARPVIIEWFSAF